jgi:hypothetical protein
MFDMLIAKESGFAGSHSGIVYLEFSAIVAWKVNDSLCGVEGEYVDQLHRHNDCKSDETPVPLDGNIFVFASRGVEVFDADVAFPWSADSSASVLWEAYRDRGTGVVSQTGIAYRIGQQFSLEWFSFVSTGSMSIVYGTIYVIDLVCCTGGSPSIGQANR